MGSFLAVHGLLSVEHTRIGPLTGVGLPGGPSIYRENFYYCAQNTKLLTAFGIALVIFGILIIINKFKNK